MTADLVMGYIGSSWSYLCQGQRSRSYVKAESHGIKMFFF